MKMHPSCSYYGRKVQLVPATARWCTVFWLSCLHLGGGTWRVTARLLGAVLDVPVQVWSGKRGWLWAWSLSARLIKIFPVASSGANKAVPAHTWSTWDPSWLPLVCVCSVRAGRLQNKSAGSLSPEAAPYMAPIAVLRASWVHGSTGGLLHMGKYIGRRGVKPPCRVA